MLPLSPRADYFLSFVCELRLKVMWASPSLPLTHVLLMVRRLRWFQLQKQPNQHLMFKKILAILYELHRTPSVLSRVICLQINPSSGLPGSISNRLQEGGRSTISVQTVASHAIMPEHQEGFALTEDITTAYGRSGPDPQWKLEASGFEWL